MKSTSTKTTHNTKDVIASLRDDIFRLVMEFERQQNEMRSERKSKQRSVIVVKAKENKHEQG